MNKPLMLCDMGLSVRAFTVLRREGYVTVEDAVQNLPHIAMTAKKTCKELCEKLHEHGCLPYDLGHWITDPDDLGDPIPFDELEGYVGKLVLTDLSTESQFFCKVVMPVKILESDTDGRSVLYYDGGQNYGRVNERWFTQDEPQMYRLRFEPVASELLPEEPITEESEETEGEIMGDFINIDSTAFDGMRSNFNDILRDTLLTMQRKDSSSASLTVKIDISLNPQDANGRTMIVPTFTHKVASAIQMKEERSGKFGGRHELYYDEIFQNFAMKEIPPIEGQMDLPFI